MNFSDLKKQKRLPNYKTITKQYHIKIDGIKHEVIQSLRSYGIGMRQRGFVKIKEQIYELPNGWTGEVF